MKIVSGASKLMRKEGNKYSPVLFALVAIPQVAEYQQEVRLLPRASSPLFCWRFSLKLYLLLLGWKSWDSRLVPVVFNKSWAWQVCYLRLLKYLCSSRKGPTRAQSQSTPLLETPMAELKWLRGVSCPLEPGMTKCRPENKEVETVGKGNVITTRKREARRDPSPATSALLGHLSSEHECHKNIPWAFTAFPAASASTNLHFCELQLYREMGLLHYGAPRAAVFWQHHCWCQPHGRGPKGAYQGRGRNEGKLNQTDSRVKRVKRGELTTDKQWTADWQEQNNFILSQTGCHKPAMHCLGLSLGGLQA